MTFHPPAATYFMRHRAAAHPTWMTNTRDPQITIVVIDDDFHWSGLDPVSIGRAIHSLGRSTAR
jgi:hypothetical protein